MPSTSRRATCEICQRTLYDKKALKKHLEAVHKVFKDVTKFNCATCGHTSDNLNDAYEHAQEVHFKPAVQYCSYCQSVFISLQSYLDHMNEIHELPAPSRVDESHLQPTASESAFEGSLKVYRIASLGELDLFALMLRSRPEIDRIVTQNTQLSARKVQFVAKMLLHKPLSDDDNETYLYADTRNWTVFFDGLSNQQFLAMVEQMLSRVNCWASYGSGWVVKSIEMIEVKLSKFAPIKASSYIGLPASLSDASSTLLNIRNHNDQRCFFYCYTAAHHLKFGPDLYDRTRVQTSHRARTSPNTYSSENPLAHQPEGQYPEPMGLRSIPRFETANNVQVNVFR